MATATKLTWEEFERLPDDGWHHELLEGEHIAVAPPRFAHSRIAHRILALFSKASERIAFIEAGYQIGRENWIQPDVSIPTRAQLKDPMEGGYLQGAPDLAVEIVSPSETAAILDRKVDRLLAAGAAEVWVVYPDTRKVHVFRGPSTEVKHPGDVIATAVLPGWQADVRGFFED